MEYPRVMIRFAVIGTNWITRQFVEAAHESGKYSNRLPIPAV